MAEPLRKPTLPQPLPPRDEIASDYLGSEDRVVSGLIGRAMQTAEEKRRIEELAKRLVHAARAGRKQFGGVDAFLAEYGLSTDEGVVLMCLAEALLRIPDKATADDLIDDKIKDGDWRKHFGASESLFVNASTFGLKIRN